MMGFGVPMGMQPGMVPAMQGMAQPGLGMHHGFPPPVHSGQRPTPEPMELGGARTNIPNPDVFISLRFNEAGREGDILQDALAKHNIKAYIDRSGAGEDILKNISRAIRGCKLAVILGTKTYGKTTGGMFDTYKEMQFILGTKKPYVLIKMCDRFEQDETDFQFSHNGIGYIQWTPGSAMPASVIPTIKARLSGAPPPTESPAPGTAPEPAPPSPEPEQVPKFCPAGHVLQHRGRRSGWSCDNPQGCSRGGIGSDDWRCQNCDFDLCGLCYSQVAPGERAPQRARPAAGASEDDDENILLSRLKLELLRRAMINALEDAVDNMDSTWPGGIQKKTRVRVVHVSRQDPNVQVGAIGIVVGRDESSGSYTVNFGGSPNWRAESKDIVMDTKADQVREGARVMIKPSVKTLKYGGSPDHTLSGYVKEVDLRSCKVAVELGKDKPWVFDIAELDPASSNFGNWPGRIQCGNAVKVKAGVETPKKQWGNVRPGDVGIAKRRYFTPDGEELILIDFPRCDNWKGIPAEIEVDAAADCIRPLARVQVKKSLEEPEKGWQGVTHSSVGVVKKTGYDGRVVVKFEEQADFESSLRELSVLKGGGAGGGGSGKCCSVS
eukprot:CAMPEP_0177690494 /NCGR_PEP_ID=MMETSP0484_2-20121128/795_1 /TAXON_ID=354590 /ORGANISM="Rhodomonas lens, Strain RHODO" /LENGTH=607 /DNA_ID=CAMNT_0019201039 /DNA_START=91 /DNA_END=1914 /DNA_ORIENTATION=+